MQIKSQAAEAHSRIEPGLSHKKYYHPCICSSGGSRIWRGEVRLFPSPPLPFPSHPSPPFPSHSPPLHYPSPPLHYPSPPFPFLSLPRPYPFPPSPPLRSRTPWLRLEGLGELKAPPAGPGGARLPNAFWCIFSLSGRILASIFKQLVLSKITITYPSPIFSRFFLSEM